MNTDRKGEKKLKYLKQYLKTHTHFLLLCDSFPENTYLEGRLMLVGKASLFPRVDGNPVPGCWGVQAAKGAGREGKINRKGAATSWDGGALSGRE